MATLETELQLDRFAGYIRRETALQWAAWGLISGFGTAVLVNLLAWILPVLTLVPRVVISLGICSVAALAPFLLAYLYPRSSLDLARISDARMGLYARLATAVEIRDGQIAVSDAIASRQRGDAIAAARAADPALAFRLVFPRRKALFAAALLVALIAGLAIPNPQENVIARRRAQEESVAKQIERLENVRDEVAANPNLSEHDRETLLQEIDDTIHDLRKGGLSTEEAVARLSATEDKLKQLLDKDADAMDSAIRGAGRQAVQDESTREIGESLAKGDYQGAAQSLETLAEQLDQMSGQERSALAGQLESLANAVEAADPNVAQALREAAEALRAGDLVAAQEALRRAAASIEQAGQRVAAQQATKQALGQVQEGRREIAQSGQGLPEEGQPGQGEQGQGEQPQREQGQQGSGQDQGGQNEQGLPAGPGGPIEPNQPGEGGEREYDPIYAPERLVDGEGERVDLPGGDAGVGPPTGETDGRPPDKGQALVPYDQVYADYEAQAISALENSYIPRGIKEYVRSYFSSLEPER